MFLQGRCREGKVLGTGFSGDLDAAPLAVADDVNRECRRDVRNVEACPGGGGEEDQVADRQRFNVVGTALAMRRRIVAASITQAPLDQAVGRVVLGMEHGR